MADSAIETAKINNDAVTQAKIADDAVGPDQLAANAVVTGSIANGTIIEADMGDNAITLAKMASLARGKIIVGDSAGDPSALAIGSNGTVLSSDGTDVSWGTVSGGPTFKTFGTSSIMIGDDATGTIDAANYNTGLGVDAFAALTTSDDNVAIGFEAGKALTSAVGRNVIIGYQAGITGTTGCELLNFCRLPSRKTYNRRPQYFCWLWCW